MPGKNAFKLVFVVLLTSIFGCKRTNKTSENGIVLNREVVIDSTSKTEFNITKNKVLGKLNYDNDSSFIKVDLKFTSKTIYLRREVYESFKKMHYEAAKNGIKLNIVSGARNFYQQKWIWENKWKKYKSLSPYFRSIKILEYSSMPTTSRHHWGTDLDLINLNNLYFRSGKGKKAYEWLRENANTFGFYQVYDSKKEGRTGYHEEMWHWSYLPTANFYLKYYNENIDYSDLSGFLGSELADSINVIKNYVNGISSPALKYD